MRTGQLRLDGFTKEHFPSYDSNANANMLTSCLQMFTVMWDVLSYLHGYVKAIYIMPVHWHQ